MVQSFLVKDSLPNLSQLAINRACELMDAQSQLTNLSDLKISYDTLYKPYHGEWFEQTTHLVAKCPCNVPLGVPGVYPSHLESLQLHTQCSDPITITTDSLKDQPRPYPHQVSMALFILHIFSLCVAAPDRAEPSPGEIVTASFTSSRFV